MGIPTSYLTSVKNVDAILTAIRAGKAPDRFSQRYLVSLDFKSTSDRLIIPVLKSLGFLQDNGAPTKRYYEFLDQTQSGRVLAEAIEEAYSALFQLNRKAYDLSKAEVQSKFKTLTEGKVGDAVLDKMAMTFKKLCSLADWKAASVQIPVEKKEAPTEAKVVDAVRQEVAGTVVTRLPQLAYVIQIHLPESRDPAVYDALFRSLKEHLLR